MTKNIFTILTLTIFLGFFTGCGNNTDIGKEKAVKIALEDAGFTESDVTNFRVTKDNDNGKSIYEVDFTTSGAEYEYEISSSDGEIVGVEYDRTNPFGGQNQQTSNNLQDTQSEQQNDPKQDMFDQNNSTQSSSEENASAQNDLEQDTSGQSNSLQNNSQMNTQISIEEASQLVLERVPNASLEDLKIEADYDDGIYVYEGEIIFDNIECEFKIDANTGEFLKWNEDKD